MSTTNDIVQNIVGGLDNLPRRSEIDTPTNNIDELATDTRDGLMSKEDKVKLDSVSVGANKYVLPTAGYNSLGGIKSASTVEDASGFTPCPIIDGVVYYNDLTEYIKSNYVSYDKTSTSMSFGQSDEPLPVYAGYTKVTHKLYNGNSELVATIEALDSVNVGYVMASELSDGIMSKEDKVKLDGIAEGANNYTLPTASSSTLGGVTTSSDVTSTIGLTACPIIGGIPYYKTNGEVDSVLSDTSTNPLENKAIFEALNTKFDKTGGIISGLTRISGGNQLQTNYINGDYTDYNGDLSLNYNTPGSKVSVYGPINSDYTLDLGGISSYGQMTIHNGNSWDVIFRHDGHDFFILQSDSHGGEVTSQRPLYITSDGTCNINGNANTVDGLHADDFAKSVSPRITGDMVFENSSNQNTINAIYSSSDTLVLRNVSKDGLSVCDLLISNDGVRIANATQNFIIGDGGNADTLDGYHADAFVNANDMDQIQIPSNVDVPVWIYENAKRYQRYMTNVGNVGLTNVPNDDTEWVWYLYDGINIIAREWTTGRYYICDMINGSFSGWKDIYTSRFKPYVTGEVTGTSGSAIITTNHGFTPSAVFWWMISEGRVLRSAYSFDTTSFTLPSSLSSDALVNYIIFR